MERLSPMSITTYTYHLVVSREGVADASKRLTVELEGTFRSNVWTITNQYHIVMYVPASTSTFLPYIQKVGLSDNG